MLLPKTNFEGTLQYGDNETEIDFEAEVFRNGEIVISFNTNENNESIVLSICIDLEKDKTKINFAVLKGKNSDSTFESCKFYFSSSPPIEQEDGTLLAKGKCLTAIYSKLEKLDFPTDSVIYHLQGIECYGPLTGNSYICDVPIQAELNGVMTIRDDKHFKDVTGGFLIKPLDSKPSNNNPNWITECQRYANRALDVLSFACSRDIRWLAYTIVGEDSYTMHFWGTRSTTKHHRSTFHFLHLNPIFDIAIKSELHEFIRESGLAIAIQWFNTPPNIKDLQFLGGMTAVEFLCERHFTQHNLTVMPEKDFNEFKKQMRKWLPEESGLSKEYVDPIRRKINSLNRVDLNTKVAKLLSDYEVDISDLDEDIISKVISVRNAIVHSSLQLAREEGKVELEAFGDLINKQRELIVRLILRMIGYSGRYISWRNNFQEDREI